MVKHGALSRPHIYRMLASEDAHVRRAAFTLLEASNPKLRRNSELFIEIAASSGTQIPITTFITSSVGVISSAPHAPTPAACRVGKIA
jgi:hypothetical protein